jgi:HSP20 family protein
MATTKPERRTEWWPELMPRRWLEWLDWPGIETMRREEHMLRVEEFEEDGQLVVRAEMPGIDPEKDVHVSLRDHTLEVRAERKQEETHEEHGVRRSEFRYGSFYRAVPLPPDAKESDVRATYKDGILELRVPLEAEKAAEPTQIPVERG